MRIQFSKEVDQRLLAFLSVLDCQLYENRHIQNIFQGEIEINWSFYWLQERSKKTTFAELQNGFDIWIIQTHFLWYIHRKGTEWRCKFPISSWFPFALICWHSHSKTWSYVITTVATVTAFCSKQPFDTGQGLALNFVSRTLLSLMK